MQIPTGTAFLQTACSMLQGLHDIPDVGIHDGQHMGQVQDTLDSHASHVWVVESGCMLCCIATGGSPAIVSDHRSQAFQQSIAASLIYASPPDRYRPVDYHM